MTCVLSVASAAAWAQSVPTTAVSVAPNPAVVDKARSVAAAAEQKLAQLSAQRRPLVVRYQQQLAAIDGLKKQKASWRRDRELNTAQANANDTATRLTALDKQIGAAQRAVATARTAVLVAIDAELKAGATGPRATQLAQLRTQLVPAAAPKKIVIPDAEIDPLADPEELERQAAAIAAAEKLLETQRRGLDAQHEELVLVAELRQAHDRAGELSTRDDDQPHRGAARATNLNSGAEQAPTAGDSTGAGQGSGGGGGLSSGGGGAGEDFNAVGDKGSAAFESSVVALGEVIDRSTIDGMLRASRSGDPKQRAEAAAAARDAVAKRLELLKKKRAMIEARAKKLRSK